MSETAVNNSVARCIGCGCTDVAACTGGCYWIHVDYERGIGVCNKCNSCRNTKKFLRVCKQRGSAKETHRAHNPETAGASPAPATKKI